MNFSLNNVLISGADAAQSVAESWDSVWDDVLSRTGSNSPTSAPTTLYGVLCWVGMLFALGTLLFLVFELYKDLNENRPISLTSLVWPLLVAFLLTNNGENLADVIYGLREIINRANTQVIAITLAGARLNELYQQANGNIGLQTVISSLMQPCQSLTGEAQIQCLNRAVSFAQEYVDAYTNTFGSSSWLDNIQGFIDGVTGAISGGNGVDSGIFGLLKPIWMPIVVSVLYWMQIAYQNLLEASLIITALLAPIAVGGSLLPYGPRSVFAWLTGFFSIGFARLCFNIIIGLTSVVAMSADGGDPFWFALFAGLLAPLLASSLASGAGLMVWTSISSAFGKSIKTVFGLII
jgi:hypothetical protein